MDRVAVSIWRHIFKMAAMTSFYTERCCRLVSDMQCLPSACSSLRQFLICGTFVLVVTVGMCLHTRKLPRLYITHLRGGLQQCNWYCVHYLTYPKSRAAAGWIILITTKNRRNLSEIWNLAEIYRCLHACIALAICSRKWNLPEIPDYSAA